MKLAVHSSNASATSETQVSETVFGRGMNVPLVHQVVTALMAGARQGSKAQRNRSDRRGGGRKPWRQKGTGRARAGSIRSPIWRGGGVTFAAKPQDHSQKINKKMYRAAFQSVLSELVRRDLLVVVDDFSLEAPKTKLLNEKLKNFGTDKALLITEYFDENLYLSARNIPNVFVMESDAVTPLDCLRSDKVIVTLGALKKLEEVVQ